MNKKTKILLVTLMVLFLVIAICSYVSAVTISETTNASDGYDTIEKGSYIIGATKFKPDTIITGALAAKAGANDMKMYIAKNGTAEGYEYPKVYYYNSFGKWKEYTPEGTLKEADLKTSSLEIYYVDNEPKKGTDSVTNTAIEIPTVKSTSYTVMFMNNEKVISTQIVEEGKTAEIPANPTKTGYTFKGWVDENEKEITGRTITPKSDMLILAKWQANSHSLTYKVDEETYGEAEVVNYGTAINAKAEPTKTGYTFSGWSTIPATMPDEDVLVTGTFTINKYTVIWKDEDGTVLKTDENVEYGTIPSYGDSNPVKAADSYTYSFNSWVPEVSAVTEDVVYVAKYNTIVDLSAQILTQSSEFVNKYYNKYSLICQYANGTQRKGVWNNTTYTTTWSNVPEGEGYNTAQKGWRTQETSDNIFDASLFYIEIGECLDKNITSITINGVEYDKATNRALSIGNSAFLYAPVFKVENYRLYVALPWLIGEALPEANTTIEAGSSTFNVKVYESTTNAALHLQEVISTNNANNNVTVTEENGMFTITQTANANYVMGLTFSTDGTEATSIRTANKVFYRLNTKSADRDMALSASESLSSGNYKEFISNSTEGVNRNVTYGLYVGVGDRCYKIASPEYGTISINLKGIRN